jgi:hypothetical protein
MPHVRARSPRRAGPRPWAWRGVTSGRCGRSDVRDVLQGGSIFLLLMTP